MLKTIEIDIAKISGATPMKKTCRALLCAVTLAVTASGAAAADVSVESSTFFGIAQREVTGASKETLLPATQFLGLTAEKLADGNLSLHLHGWGRADLSDNSYNDEKSAGSLTYGYLNYRFNVANANVSAGRLFVRGEGVVNEQVDGVSARTDLPMGFGLSAFGGAPVHAANLSGESSDGKGNAIFGGRANYRYKGMFEVGLSGVFESAAPELVAHTGGDYRRVGGDFSLTPIKSVDIIGHSSYNTELSQFAEHSYLFNYKPVQKLVLSGEFNKYQENRSTYLWNTLSSTLKPDVESTAVGLRAFYEINKNLEVAGDYKHYKRENGKADRIGGDARVNYNDNSIRGGVAYHYLDVGDGFSIGTNPSVSYHELRCYTMRDTKSYFAAVDIIGDFFTEKIYNENSAWEIITSLGYHFTPALALSGDISYGRNPQFSQEAKALLRLTYNTAFIGSGGKK